MNVAYLQPGEIRQTGWYWFQAGDNSPREMRRGFPVIVLVGLESACELEVGETRDPLPLVRFPQGTYR